MTEKMKSNKSKSQKEHKPVGIKLVKVSALSKTEIAKLNFKDLWIMKPPKGKEKLAKASLCGCRSVCLA